MPELPPKSEPGSEDDDSGTPRWVKVLGMIAFVLVLVFIVLHLTGRGLGGHTHRSPVTEQGVKRP
jgi:hypothetical protein